MLEEEVADRRMVDFQAEILGLSKFATLNYSVLTVGTTGQNDERNINSL